ncbi:ZIP family metal transporter [Nonomuraea sp. NPDC050783]|uniref:ZIP family metal transporter n=1 Tax=Nonomuraea sp. NPDC050783 TaxID=3154634 RepID=UPI0034663F0B
MPVWLQAGLWGALAGGALLIGAAIAWFRTVPPRLIAAIMAFGAGVLIAALSFELLDEAERTGGLAATAAGFLAGACAYVAANALLARRGARHRKRSGGRQPSEDEVQGSGAAIAVGALLDGVPESVVLGVSLLGGGDVGIAVVAAVFISNVPEGLSSVAGMKRAGRGPGYVFGIWGGIALASGLAALIGNLTMASASPAATAVIMGVAAGAILAMVADTMIPEAFEDAHVLTGLITTVGFLSAFAIERLAG